MPFVKQVLAYLTGWLIVQPTYNRLLAAWRRRELRNPRSETQEYFRQQARAFVAELHHYTPGQAPPAGLELIVAQHNQIADLQDERGRLLALLSKRDTELAAARLAALRGEE